MEENRPRGVPLSPKSMVDSVADWPLHRVVEHLRKKEKEEKSELQPSRMFCRSTIKSLVDVIDHLAGNYGASRNRMCRWLSYHGIAFAREDVTISKLAKAQMVIRSACIPEDDTDTMDIMNSLTPYAPRVVDENQVHIYLYDAWVASDFEELARICGVYKYRIVQVFLIKSLLTGDVDALGETAGRLQSELSRWDKWMSFRLSALEGLVRQKSWHTGIRVMSVC